MRNLIFLILVLSGFFYSGDLYSQSPRELILQMIDSARSLRGFKAEITKEERVKGEIIKQISAVKLIREPFQLYLHQLYPKKGVEVLLRTNDHKPLVNPNAFPWFNLNLDPYGSLMRRNQHHTIFDSGFDLMINILSEELAALANEDPGYIKYKGLISWEGRPSHHIELNYDQYSTKNYKVQNDEDLNAIARKLNINEYAIMELNENIDFYDDVDDGQEIIVPTHYARKMVLFIDNSLMLPLVIKVYDNHGLFEQYAYRNFEFNPVFKEGEFTSNYVDYNF